jgi:Arc/MetJ-type ribon-helix-helix transcriptional regulator
MAEPVKTTIRLTDKDQSNIDKIIRTGIATNTSEAIRVGLAVAPQFLTMWKALMDAKVDSITDTLTQLQEELRRDREDAMPDFSKVNWTVEEVLATAPSTSIGDFTTAASTSAAASAPILEKIPQFLLEAWAAVGDHKIATAARNELLRRGLFFDGISKWVENRPDLTVRVPSAPIHGRPVGNLTTSPSTGRKR